MSNPKLATEKQVQEVSDTFIEIINHQGKQIKALESGVIDAIEPSSPAPTKRGEYKVTKPGVFLNFKDANGQPISVTQEDYSSGNVSIIFNGTDSRKLVVPITFEGEVKEGDTRGVSGGEVYNNALVKYIDKNVLFEGKNLFNKNDIQHNTSLNTLGQITNVEGNSISSYIFVKKGIYTLSGWFVNDSLKRISFFKKEGDKTPIVFFNTNTFTTPEDGYICFLLTTATLDYKNTCQLEVGSIATEYESYIYPIIEEKIKDKYLPETEVCENVSLERIDKRFVDKSIYNQYARDLLNYNNFVKSLSNIRGEGIERFATITLTEVTENLIVPLNIHYGIQQGNNNPFHVYFNKKCNKDLSDLRFFDTNGNELQVLKKEALNAEAILDSKLMFFTASLSNGDFVAHNTQADGMYRSTDNGVTWVKFKDVGSIVGVAPNDNILYEIGDKLYLTTPESDYTDEILKLTNDMPGGTWGWQHWIIDALGNCFTAPYQEGLNVKIYKSPDNGVTWLKTYDVVGESQHVHSFTIDKTNNHMYVNCDAGEPNWIDPQDPKSQRTLVSEDFGNTWKRLEIPFPTDYGIVYANAEKKIWLTSGESAIKSMPTLSISRDLVTWEPLIESTANGGTIKELNDVLYFFQRSHSTNQYVKILVSKDFGLTWNEWMSTGQIAYSDMGCTWGRGSNLNLKDKDGKEFFIIGSNNQYVSKLPRARVYAEEENNQALFYVKMPKTKSGSNVISIKSGYLTDVIDSNMYEDYTHPNLVCHLPINSETDTVLDVITRKEYILKGDFKWGKLNKRELGWVYPFVYRANSSALSIDRKKPLEIDDILKKDKDFSISFWVKFENNYLGDATKTRHLFGRKNDTLSFYAQRENRLLCKIGDSIKVITGIFKIENNRLFTHVTITIDNNNIYVYVNGNLFKTTPYVYIPNINYDKWVIMGDIGLNNTLDSDYICDFMVFDNVLSNKEILKIFESNTVIKS